MCRLRQTLDQLADDDFRMRFLRDKVGPDVEYQSAPLIFLSSEQVDVVSDAIEFTQDHADPFMIGIYVGTGRITVYSEQVLPRDFGFSIETYEGISFTYNHPVESTQLWLDGRHEDDNQKRAGQLALQTQRQLRKRKKISNLDLAPIMDAIRSPYMVSWEPGQSALSKLAGLHPEARAAWMSLLQERKAKVRARAFSHFGDHLPKSFCLDVLRQGLTDRSKEVRRLSALYSEVLCLSEMLDDLIALRDFEKSENVLGQLEYSIDMFQKGYHYNKSYGSLWVRYADGSVKSVGDGKYNRAYFESNDLAVVADEIRRKFPLVCERRPLTWPHESN